MDETDITLLLQDLKSDDEQIREQATETLWQIWYTEKGEAGFQALQRAQVLLQAGEPSQAEVVLTDLIQALPDFAEAWNRRAVLYYLCGEYRRAIADCEAAIRFNPIHFGALHGLGLCHVAIGDYRTAIQAFQKALEIQPYAIQNQRLILECTAHLS